MNTPLISSGYLLLSAAGLLVVALSYGVKPTVVLPRILKVTLFDRDLIHIFRAVMGLYMASLSLWVVGAFVPSLMQTAMIAEVVFMGGLAAGRTLSLILDGRPSNVLIFYLIIETTLAAAGIFLLMN